MRYFQIFFNIFKKHYRIIIILGSTFGSMITFPVFGPVLLHMVGLKYVLLMSSFSLLFLTIGYLIKPFYMEIKSNILLLLSFVSAFLLGISFFLPLWMQFLAIALFSFSAGRIIVFWSKLMFKEVSINDRAKVISMGLFFAYGFLYLTNVIISFIPKPITPLFSVLLILIAAVLLKKDSTDNMIPMPAVLDRTVPIPWILFSLIFLIYITAGITYAEVYPGRTSYPSLDRFYNVLPFVLAVNVAGYISDTWGRKYSLFIGISLLGISFSFFLMESSIISYFLIQSIIEIAWAFLDLYVLVVIADIAERLNRREYYTFGLAFFSSGTLFGAILCTITRNIGINQTVYALLAHLPLFIAVAFLGRIPETLKKQEEMKGFLTPSDEMMDNIFILLKDRFSLTPREMEVTFLILQGLSNVQISNKLYISENTVKYHLKNIFHKSGITNRNELRSYVINLIKQD